MKRITYCLLLGSFLAADAVAQDGGFTFGISWKSQSLSRIPSNQPGVPMNDGDILTFGPGSPDVLVNLAAPSIAIRGDQLGLAQYTNCLGHAPDTPCGIEVDGFSQGNDPALRMTLDPGGLTAEEEVWFSTDEFAIGAGSLLVAPNVKSEGGSVGDISADVWVVPVLPLGPVGPPPLGGSGTHVGVFDGNGLPSAAPSGLAYPGIGLIEPNFPGMGGGDDLDSLNIGAAPGFPPSGYYTTLDSSFTDPLTGIPNSGTAAAQLVPRSGADVLFVASSGATPVPWAPALSLGLDLMGVGTDDIDAIAIAENGVPGFQVSIVPYDWNGSMPKDMVLFSVRRGSAVIGSPDSIFGRPIEPGDILTAPLPTGMGGLSPFPGILFAAESLGLATARTDLIAFGDDLNALDFASASCIDCNNNGVEDAVDISTGASSDANGNGVPDECEKIEEYCQCPAADAPCGNSNDEGGCGNSQTSGAHLYFMGTNSVAADDLVLVTDQVPTNKFGLYYMGGGQISVTLGDGVRCVGGSTFRYGIMSSGAGGVFTMGPGIVATSCANWVPGCIASGDTWNFQAWYRDPPGPCASQFNFSNGLSVEFVP